MFKKKSFTKKSTINAKRYEDETDKLVEEQKAKLDRIVKLTPIEIEQEKQNTQANVQRSQFQCEKIIQDNKVESFKLEAEAKKIKFEIEKFKQKDNIKKAKLEIKQHEELTSKSVEYEKISKICTAMSIFMTIGGILFMKGCKTLTELFKQGTVTYIAIAAVIVMQSAVIKCNKDDTIRERYFSNQTAPVNILKYMTIGTSMFCNFFFLRSFGFGVIVSLSLAIGLDLNSLICATIATDFKFRNYSFENVNADVGLLNMISFVITSKLKRKIKCKYDAELNEYKNVFGNIEENSNMLFAGNTIDNEHGIHEVLLAEDKQNFTDEKKLTNLENKKVSANISTSKNNTLISENENDIKDNIISIRKKKEVLVRNNNKVENARRRLKALASGTKVNKNVLGRLTDAEYRKIKEILKNEGLLHTTNNATYVK